MTWLAQNPGKGSGQKIINSFTQGSGMIQFMFLTGVSGSPVTCTNGDRTRSLGYQLLQTLRDME